ncbi:MAG: pyridoxamine 5'-phosphate oxidase family protein [Kineosporiaceae bacterium]|nr:pyridoxamine 5'-phosphate oxidase family protein [Kineosporiaceae bacterium]
MSESSTSVPARDRPIMPEGYGVPETDDGLVEWSAVEQLLVEAPQYWMSTTRADGRPHVVPRWGIWLDGHFLYDGSPATVHARNLGDNPHCALHIGDGWEAVIVEGVSRASEPVAGELGQRVAAELGRKYGERGYAPSADAWSGPDAGGLRVFTPHKAMAWFAFPGDVTRFHFS